MYQTYRYAVLQKTQFDSIETALLQKRNEAWNYLATLYNLTLDAQKEYIREFNAGAVTAVEEAAHIPLKNKIGIRTLLGAWFDECKLHSTRIRQLWEDFKEKRAAYLSDFDLYWHNKDKLYFQHEQARKGQYKLVREIALRPYTDKPKGAFHYRFKKAVDADTLFGDTTGAVGITPVENEKNTYCIRMIIDRASKDREQKTEAFWVFKMHRPLPKNCEVSAVSFSGQTDIFGHWEGQVSFTVKIKDPIIKEHGCISGIDVGWRLSGNELLCATVCLEENTYDRLFMPEEMVSKFMHLEELGHILQDSLPNNVKTNWYKYALIGEDTIWLKHTERLRMEWQNTYRKLKAARRQLYYTFANKIVEQSRIICIEKLNLLNLQCIQIEANKLHQKIVAPSLLLNTLKECAVKNGVHIEEIKANATSQSCYSCGRLNKRTGVAATRTNMVCDGCGRHYDTDENASSNIRKWGAEKLATQSSSCP